jgi:ubiquinone/menaquinone biosynthesis C-methylase UbiE
LNGRSVNPVRGNSKRQGTVTFYDLVAPIYRIWSKLLESKAHRQAVAALRERTCRNVLDVAVGNGMECAEFGEDAGIDCFCGIDLSVGMLHQARRRLKTTSQERVLLCQADARALPFRGESFDALLNCYMIDLLEETDIPAVLAEFRRVLRPDGRVVLVTMGHQGPILERVWMALFRLAPILVGGCRPFNPQEWLLGSGWQIERRQQIRQLGFHSELFIVAPAAAGRLIH